MEYQPWNPEQVGGVGGPNMERIGDYGIRTVLLQKLLERFAERIHGGKELSCDRGRLEGRKILTWLEVRRREFDLEDLDGPFVFRRVVEMVDAGFDADDVERSGDYGGIDSVLGEAAGHVDHRNHVARCKEG